MIFSTSNTIQNRVNPNLKLSRQHLWCLAQSFDALYIHTQEWAHMWLYNKNTERKTIKTVWQDDQNIANIFPSSNNE